MVSCVARKKKRMEGRKTAVGGHLRQRTRNSLRPRVREQVRTSFRPPATRKAAVPAKSGEGGGLNADKRQNLQARAPANENHLSINKNKDPPTPLLKGLAEVFQDRGSVHPKEPSGHPFPPGERAAPTRAHALAPLGGKQQKK